MKQLTIFCSRDLEHRVVSILDAADVEGYLRIGDASGNRFLPKGEHPRAVSWEAVVLVVPGAEDARIDALRAKLQEISAHCEVEPCIRLLVQPAVEVY